MTDQKRDESMDIGFFREQHVMVPWDCVHPEAASFVRYVPHADLAAAQSIAKRAVKLLGMIDRGHCDVAEFFDSLPSEYFE